jgi:hypothetical protein
MQDTVRAELVELLKAGGRNLCTTPRVVATMLRQRCPDSPAEVDDTLQALDGGYVEEMLRQVGPIDLEEITARFAEQSGLSVERARWAIESWNEAIEAADAPPAVARDWSSWNRLDVKAASGGAASRGTLAALILVAAAGALGGSAPAWSFAAGGDAVEDLPPWLQTGALVILGVLGGATGGLLGWIAVAGRSIGDGIGETASGRLVTSCLGAALGGLLGSLTGLALFGLFGVMVGSLIGAVAGEACAFLAIGGLCRYWW